MLLRWCQCDACSFKECTFHWLVVTEENVIHFKETWSQIFNCMKTPDHDDLGLSLGPSDHHRRRDNPTTVQHLVFHRRCDPSKNTIVSAHLSSVFPKSDRVNGFSETKCAIIEALASSKPQVISSYKSSHRLGLMTRTPERRSKMMPKMVTCSHHSVFSLTLMSSHLLILETKSLSNAGRPQPD